MKCQYCEAKNPKDKNYCNNCGRRLSPLLNIEVDDELREKIRFVFEEERTKLTKNQDAVVLDIAAKAYNRVRNWITGFAVVTAIILGIFGFGYKDLFKTAMTSVEKEKNEVLKEIKVTKELVREAKIEELIKEIEETKKTVSNLQDLKPIIKTLYMDRHKVKDSISEIESIRQLALSYATKFKAVEIENIKITDKIEARIKKEFRDFNAYLYKLGLSRKEKINIKLSSNPNPSLGDQSVVPAYYDEKNDVLNVSTASVQTLDPAFFHYVLDTLRRSRELPANGMESDYVATVNVLLPLVKGCAFYFTCSFNDEPKFTWSKKFFLELNEPLDANFQDYLQTQEQNRAKMWCNLFWMLRQEVKKLVADELIAKAWSGVSQESMRNLTIELFAKKLLDACQDIDDGKHFDAVSQILKKRKLQA